MDKDQRDKFKNLYKPIHHSLDRFCRVIAGNKDEGADLLHDTVLATMERFNKIKDQKALQSYMFSVASNINKKRIKKASKVSFDPEEVSRLSKESNSETLTDFHLIYEQILALPSKMSEALILFHVVDLKLEEIRVIQGGSLSGVKLRIKRGRESKNL